MWPRAASSTRSRIWIRPLHSACSIFSPSHTLSNMTNTRFKHINPTSIKPDEKPWTKSDGPGHSFTLIDTPRPVHNIRGQESHFTTDNSGFAVYHSPAKETAFTDDLSIRNGYYSEVEQLLRSTHKGVSQVYIFDHTIRRHDPSSPRQSVQQVHVDQTPRAAEARVRRHLPAAQVPDLLKRRFQLINVWRPIANPATDLPLAVLDWRSTDPEAFVPVSLMYPVRKDGEDEDDRGKEVLPTDEQLWSTEGYEPRGETMGVKPNEGHKFYYVKDMTPDEVMLLKCFDSHGQGEPDGRPGIAARAPHTAFVDPDTPEDAPGRQSIEVRCLVFY